MRAKILFNAIAILNQRIVLDSARIENLQQSKVELKQALALCENTVANNEEAIERYVAINKNDKKKGRNRTLYFSASCLVVGFLTGVIIVR